jgi:hypothetical protein
MVDILPLAQCVMRSEIAASQLVWQDARSIGMACNARVQGWVQIHMLVCRDGRYIATGTVCDACVQAWVQIYT